jgi:hypothetical protein
MGIVLSVIGIRTRKLRTLAFAGIIGMVVLGGPSTVVAAGPTISIADKTVTEPNGTATVVAAFKISLSAASGSNIQIGFHTTDGTAVAGSDYVAKSGTKTIPAGNTTGFISITVVGDDIDEVNEHFFVDLTSASSGSFADSRGGGTITDTDGPGILITNSIVDEPPPNDPMVFHVHLNATSPQTVSLHYSTANGTAAAGADYQAQLGKTLTFAPGVQNKDISVVVDGDLIDESSESFMVNLSDPVNGTLIEHQGQGTILDNDCTGSTGPVEDLHNVSGDTGSDTRTKTGSIGCGGEIDRYSFGIQEFSSLGRPLTARITLDPGDSPPQGPGTGNLKVCAFYVQGGISHQIGCGTSGTAPATIDVKEADARFCTQQSTILVNVSGPGLNVNSYLLTITGHVAVAGDPNVPNTSC